VNFSKDNKANSLGDVSPVDLNLFKKHKVEERLWQAGYRVRENKIFNLNEVSR
jgi:hypothetical protein